VSVRLLDPSGVVRDVPDELVDRSLATGWKPVAGASGFETTPGPADSLADKAAAGVASGLSTATFGASDVAFDLLSTNAQKEALRKAEQDNPGTVIGGTIVGAFADPFGASSAAAKIGKTLARTEQATTTVGKLARAGVATTIEGGIGGFGQGVSQLALSDDKVSIERAASVIGSNVLFGAGTSGVLGVAGKGVELGLGKAKGALDKYAARELAVNANIGDDLTKLDRKGLRTAEKTERDAIEAARGPKRAELADEIKSLRSEMKEQKVWLATKDADVKTIKEVREVGKIALEADRSIDRMIRNPKALAERPQRVLDGLQQQEHALEKLVAQGDNLKPIYAKDATGVRQAAFDYAGVALEKNRALQAKIGELTGKATSPRLDAIGDAMAGLGQATKKEGTTIGELLGQSALGHAVGSLAGVPYLGQAVLAAKAAGTVLKKLGANTGAAAERGSKAISTFLDVSQKIAPRARVVATRTLSNAAFGVSSPAGNKKQGKQQLADLYRARSSEIRALTAPGADGAPAMRMEARSKMADRLAPVRAANPLLADRIESNRANAVAFLASKLPRKPDLPGMGHPYRDGDTWQPSDMEMRGGLATSRPSKIRTAIVERLATGEVTPEDAEAMRSVYPEMYAQIQTEIMGQLGELRARLPYQRRLALSIFSGVPVDPALDPRVLAVLQGSFASEQGSANGTMAPVAQPAFGSVSKPEPTPAQQRGG
jgi:hypothetical protein